MSFQNLKSDSYCAGGIRRSATNNIYGDITSKCSKVLIGFCSICNRKKSMTVNDKTIVAERLSSFFRNLVKSSAKAGKKLESKV